MNSILSPSYTIGSLARLVSTPWGSKLVSWRRSSFGSRSKNTNKRLVAALRRCGESLVLVPWLGVWHTLGAARRLTLTARRRATEATATSEIGRWRSSLGLLALVVDSLSLNATLSSSGGQAKDRDDRILVSRGRELTITLSFYNLPDGTMSELLLLSLLLLLNIQLSTANTLSRDVVDVIRARTIKGIKIAWRSTTTTARATWRRRWDLIVEHGRDVRSANIPLGEATIGVGSLHNLGTARKCGRIPTNWTSSGQHTYLRRHFRI